MAVAVVTDANFRAEDMEGSFSGNQIGSGPGGSTFVELRYQGDQAWGIRLNTAGALKGFTVQPINGDLDGTAIDQTLWMMKMLLVNSAAIDPDPQMEMRIGQETAYNRYVIADDGTLGDNEDFKYPIKAGWLVFGVDPNEADWINDITGSPDITIADEVGGAAAVLATSNSENWIMDAWDIGPGLFLVGGDSTDPDGTFEDFLVADEGAATVGRFGHVSSIEGIFLVYGKLVVGRAGVKPLNDQTPLIGMRFNDNGGSPDTIARADSGSWITDGFVEGDIQVNSSNSANNKTFTIDVGGVTADILTLVSGDAVVDAQQELGAIVRQLSTGALKGAATEFTDANKTIVFPGGLTSPGQNGLEFDLVNGSTVITLDTLVIDGKGADNRKAFFDSELDVNGSTERFTLTAHDYATGNAVLYSDEGGTETIGVTDTVRYFVRNIDADTIELYDERGQAFDTASTTGRRDLTASTSGNGENHSLRRRPDTRPDFTVVGTSGSLVATLVTFQRVRVITLTSGAALNSCVLINGTSLVLGSGTVDGCIFQAPLLAPGEAFLTATTVAQLGGVDDNEFIAGDAGHAIEITTTGGTQGFVGNIFTGYGPGGTDDAGAHDHEFDSTSDISEANDTITLVPDNFVTGDAIFYSDESGSADIGLVDGNLYYLRRDSAGVYGVFESKEAADTDVNRIALTSTGAETQVLYSANAAFHNSTGGTITLQVSGGGTAPSVRNSGGSTTLTENNVSLTLTGLRDNTEVRVFDMSDPPVELAGVENATDGSSDDRSVTFSLAASLVVDIRFAHGIAADGNVYLVPDRNSIAPFTWPTTTTSLPITQVLDRSFDNPA